MLLNKENLLGKQGLNEIRHENLFIRPRLGCDILKSINN